MWYLKSHRYSNDLTMLGIYTIIIIFIKKNYFDHQIVFWYNMYANNFQNIRFAL